MPHEWQLSLYSDGNIRTIIEHSEMQSIIERCEVGSSISYLIRIINFLVLLSIHYACGVKNTFDVLMQVLETNFDINSLFHFLLVQSLQCILSSALHSQFI